MTSDLRLILTYFFSAGSGKVNIFEEAGVLKYQLEAANILKEGVLSEDTVSGIKTLTFDVEGKFENIKINFSERPMEIQLILQHLL